MFTPTAVPLAFLLLTPHQPAVLQADSCLSSSYYGQYGTQSLFIVNDTCLGSSTDDGLLSSGSVVPLVNFGDQQLVWIERQSVDDGIALFATEDITLFLDQLDVSRPDLATGSREQQILDTPSRSQILYSSPSHFLLSVSPSLALIIDTHLPRFWKAAPLPVSPVPYVAVSSAALERVRKLLASVKFDPVIASLIGDISIPQLRKDVRYLTGEDPLSPLESRHSFSEGARQAAVWLKAQFEETGASCELKPYLVGFSPNVIWYEFLPPSWRFA
ncbi:uncharacterized protein FIBRA_03009 [Fibroporia radiculosa]|uniref:Uncharacterized protein n=1 Tax=Fibroporia radiculosa TaxID=599839 RepID=J4I9D3_9APHY|nr:uncharacterized protein FIBRA_03009 [Fibroporia radiculosa]CCM00961.1 predicted protein [Fibroporia radiculosa]